MRGVNIREVQEHLCHRSLETTMIYTHVLRTLSPTAVSPLDALARGGVRGNANTYTAPLTRPPLHGLTYTRTLTRFTYTTRLLGEGLACKGVA